MEFKFKTNNRKDFLTLQNILDSTIKYNGVERTIRGLKIDDENLDSCRVDYLGNNINVYFEFNKVNGFYNGQLVIQLAPPNISNEVMNRIKAQLPNIKKN